jgi:aspartyl-tRNA synthetase
VVDFPMFEWDEEEKRWSFTHHPFTSPKAEHFDILESDPATVMSDAYDLVCNGYELASGSIRIHRRDVQADFRCLEYNDEEIQSGSLHAECLNMALPWQDGSGGWTGW